jgi:hypothetical protein
MVVGARDVVPRAGVDAHQACRSLHPCSPPKGCCVRRALRLDAVDGPLHIREQLDGHIGVRLLRFQAAGGSHSEHGTPQSGAEHRSLQSQRSDPGGKRITPGWRLV